MTDTVTTNTKAPVNRKYKARLFEMIFSKKKELLELYNAVSKTNHTDSELLEINTLENAIYMSMYNDLSFLIDSRVSLYEHQSTYNPELLDACRTLKDYSEYTAKVREYADKMPLEAAVERAITECIREGILSEFLSHNRAEAKSVSIYEYDEEKHMRQEREAEYARGMTDGIAQGISQGEQKKLSELIQKKLANGDSISKIATDLLETEDTIRELAGSLK